ncbi:DUF3592 domain-containing protein [Nostoc sp. FACHB-152]|uniref:DUF3592 domain-containing protein n=1 Tax=unclassified Nostoc TaxID=2593658 RepID=UPI0016835B51|nr:MULTISPECIES: DUF3592 domain-containing protein [unclassified Nostoc]MBD2450598.1 DUF3592 domain-containing protein [Nostoc sp. FACHB-152]MBD2471233.1 DUF3592 domain-containing protein [Nostoc sp. FACHB-145]
MRNEDVVFFRLFGSIFAGVGSIFAILGIVFVLNTHSFIGKSISTQGTVVDLERHTSTDSKGRSSTAYYPVIKFTPSSGDPIVFEANSGSNPPAHHRGQQIDILYNPQAPESAMINSWLDLWFLPGMFTGMGSLFVVIGGIPLVKSFLPKT